MTSDIPWPSASMLERMGLVRCQADPACTTWLDPANCPHRVCQRHLRKSKPKGKRVPYIPRDQRRAA